MFSFILLIVLFQPMIPAQLDPLYTKFSLFNMTLTEMYNSLGYYVNSSVPLITFDAFDPSIDYSSDTWMDPCYKQFIANNAKFLIFWINGTLMHCEAQSVQTRKKSVRFPMVHLMRVEVLKNRC